MGNNINPYLQYQYPQQNNRPQYYENQYNNFGLKGRQVSSIDEVKAMTIDFDGTIFYFPDLANNKIYTKQVNPMNGMAQLHVYELKEQPIQSPSTPPQNNNYITREEFEKAIAELRKQSTPSMPVATEKQKTADNYLQELSADIVEMINDASPEEKQLLQKKISALAQKIV